MFEKKTRRYRKWTNNTNTTYCCPCTRSICPCTSGIFLFVCISCKIEPCPYKVHITQLPRSRINLLWGCHGMVAPVRHKSQKNVFPGEKKLQRATPPWQAYKKNKMYEYFVKKGNILLHVSKLHCIIIAHPDLFWEIFCKNEQRHLNGCEIENFVEKIAGKVLHLWYVQKGKTKENI